MTRGETKLFKVLIVDDSAVIRQQLKRANIWGEKIGFEIAGEAEDGAEALQKLTLARYDLVISDIRMPKMDGMELLVNIVEKKLASCVVFLSEYTEFRYAKQGLVYGAFDYLVKPVNGEDLYTLLARARTHLLALKAAEERQKIGVAGIFLPNSEIIMLKEGILSADPKSVETASIIADKVLSVLDQDVNKTRIVLDNILQETIDHLMIHNVWLDKFINLRQITLDNNTDLKQAYKVIECFKAAIASIIEATSQFKCLDEYGPVIKELSRYVLDNIDNNISAKEVAAALYLNRSYISQVFKEKTGMTFGDYLTRLKMERAKKLVSEGDIKILEIAARLGYKDSEYFSRLFKDYTGVSPVEYRERLFNHS